MLSADFYRKFAIYGGGFFFTITGMAQPFFTLYAQELGASMAAIGFMVTLRSLLPIFIAMPVGQLIDLIGAIKMLKIGSVFLILSLFTNMIATDLYMLAISQLFMGASIIIMASSLQVMVSEGSKNERNENIKKYSMWMSCGGMLGPLIGGALTSLFASKLLGYKVTFGAACAISVMFLIFLLLIAKGYRKSSEGSKQAAKEMLKFKGIMDSYMSGIHLTKSRAVQFGLIGTFLIMYIQVLFSSFMPIYLDEKGYTTLLISIIISAQSLAGMMSRFALGWIMKRTHLERILLFAGLIASVCLIFTPVAVLHTTGIIVLVMIMGSAVGINLPVSMMIMVNDTEEADRGKLMGLRLLMNRFSQIISPAMFGVLGQSLGLTVAFYTGGAFLIATILGFSLYSSAKWGLKTEGIDSVEKPPPKSFVASPSKKVSS
ncbi:MULTISPECIES: MFS transporter [unclassified Paenibacillus]|uniref:MFS transporter n=1 Tax=unclassified Paenibacillus TaxID=185978 RepID=UPI001AE56134|nr:MULTISPECIES: MFS transporter [unclassified Paenibacillus]MBP1156416.1 MFS family permease [Paenibacillus sp. PvP091]MBP1168198.1 MFS family permease [Paenibacillus sp. PvR098]MBP2439226.1 MFS family permease [Paenibacillus sp. PvP052]